MNEIARVADIPTLSVEKAQQMLAKCRGLDEAKDIRDKAAALHVYARGKAAGFQAAQDGKEIELWADRRIGELTKEIPKAPTRVKKGLSNGSLPNSKAERLESAGITKMQASRAEAIAEVPLAEFQQRIQAAREEDRPLSQATVLTTSGSADYDGNEWFTPAEYIAAARSCMGSIDLDPASCKAAQKTVGASEFFTKRDNGLSLEWHGNVWLNPPYSHPEVELFTKALIDAYDDGSVKQAVLLVNNCTDAAWCQALLNRFPCCFTAGRVKFTNAKGALFATRQGQAIFYLGKSRQRFLSSFQKFGTVVVAG